ncbi:MAG TPA: hypothetical protein VF482_19845, partial [Trebonia sp.]
AGRLRDAMDHAWHLPASARTAARDTAARQRHAGREAYVRFRNAVETKRVMPTAERRELVT